MYIIRKAVLGNEAFAKLDGLVGLDSDKLCRIGLLGKKLVGFSFSLPFRQELVLVKGNCGRRQLVHLVHFCEKKAKGK